ncbi:gliding motility-associated C-terminal domain-containing protein, partial [Lishizhenia tianjinensis]
MLIATSDIGCVDTIVKMVTVEPEVIMYAPNTFTPDGDEYNNSWRVFVEGIDVYSVELTIYNRWGEVIWKSFDLEQQWDGTYNGKQVPTGVYTWTFKARNKQDDAKFTKTGYVQVMR